jgi:hypothetical protein
MVEITLPIVLQIIQTVSLIMGITYYLFIMRNSQRTRELTLQSQELTRKAQEQAMETRQAQLYMSLLDRWNTNEFSNQRYDSYRMEWTDLDDFIEKYNARNNPDIFASWNTFGRSILGLAELHRKGLIDIDFLDGMMLTDIVGWWNKFGALEKERWERGRPAWESHFPLIMEAIDWDRKRRPNRYDDVGNFIVGPNQTWVQPEEIMQLRRELLPQEHK